ncbi:hypothetical protein GON03_09375 [Nocardioides sp. MAH-18]|uniref:Uncharacterized protein n=1 Tax=Nocardioides agri TaxID=2682843 RepID=A0A6L6XPY5_9ACTN|nr:MULTISPECIES: hypothetical protein [unclassified Nocardioides]MBA2954532.1 hypothetical protein [Nocardioides sp. CGMCC 1.13656]MVQ49391.1 hypothetical protein [Nocardioides sp. MAH-18]
MMLSDDTEPVATPFEEWCAARNLHPDDSRAWPLYEASVAPAAQTPAAS